jgi:fructokinase
MPGVCEPTTTVIGENLVDLLVDAEGHATAMPGGGPFNVARTIARLGQAVTLFSSLSSDAFRGRLAVRPQKGSGEPCLRGLK